MKILVLSRCNSLEGIFDPGVKDVSVETESEWQRLIDRLFYVRVARIDRPIRSQLIGDAAAGGVAVDGALEHRRLRDGTRISKAGIYPPLPSNVSHVSQRDAIGGKTALHQAELRTVVVHQADGLPLAALRNRCVDGIVQTLRLRSRDHARELPFPSARTRADG